MLSYYQLHNNFKVKYGFIDQLPLPIAITDSRFTIVVSNRHFRKWIEENPWFVVEEGTADLTRLNIANDSKGRMIPNAPSDLSTTIKIKKDDPGRSTWLLSASQLEDGLFLIQILPDTESQNEKEYLNGHVVAGSFYRHILDNLPSDVVVFDQNQRYVYLNEHAVKDPEMRKWLIGKNDFDYCQKRNVPKAIAETRRDKFNQFLYSDALQFSFEETITVNHRKTTNLRIYSKLSKENGTFDYIIGYGFNISQLKDYENRIAYLESAIDLSTDGIALLDQEGRYTYLNKAHVTMFGYKDESELLGKSWHTIYNQSEIIRIEQEVFPLLKANKKWSGETAAISADKISEVTTEISLTLLPNGGLVCICRDIKERKLKDEQLERLAIVASRTKSMVVVTDAEAKTEWVNQAFIDKTGYSFEEIKGKVPGTLLNGPECDPSVLKKLAQCIAEKKSFSGEKLSYMKDGSKVWFYINANPIFNRKGEVTNWISVETDISVLKEAEKKIQESLDKERYLSEMKSRFVSMASHEFRTPLAGIQSCIDLAEIGLEKIKDEKKAILIRHLNNAGIEIKKMTDIMDNILLFGKLKSEKVRHSPHFQSFDNFIETVIKETGIKYPYRMINLKRGKQPIWFSFDSSQLYHVFYNLIQNALKYSKELTAVDVQISSENEFLNVVVNDRGIGIPEKEQNRLFESFFRASNAENIQGTGMGLVIAKHFVDTHGGKISIESKENQGCKVTVIIPLN